MGEAAEAFDDVAVKDRKAQVVGKVCAQRNAALLIGSDSECMKGM